MLGIGPSVGMPNREHVDAGQRIVEHDAVEQRWATLEQADIAQMEIAMAAPNAPVFSACIEESSDRAKLRHRCNIQQGALEEIARYRAQYVGTPRRPIRRGLDVGPPRP